MKLAVPYYNQHNDISDTGWKGRACTITNLAMVLGFLLGDDAPSPDELLQEGIMIGGYSEHGWVHDHITFLAHNHSVLSYKEEFRSRDTEIAKKLEDEGIEKIKRTLRHGLPVIISIMKDNGSYHTVTLNGVDSTGFFVHDPELGKEGVHMSFDEFWETWRRLCIFFE